MTDFRLNHTYSLTVIRHSGLVANGKDDKGHYIFDNIYGDIYKFKRVEPRQYKLMGMSKPTKPTKQSTLTQIINKILRRR